MKNHVGVDQFLTWVLSPVAARIRAANVRRISTLYQFHWRGPEAFFNPERHQACLESTENIHLKFTPQHQGLPVALLRTCRSIHREAAPILLSDKTFSFSKPGILDPFLRLALSSSQRRLLQTVHVYADDPGFCLGAYGFGMYGFSLQDRYQQTASLLDGLKRLKLTLGKCMAKSLTRLVAFGTSLESLEVVIGPQVKDQFGGTGFSSAQNRKMAEAIRNGLDVSYS